MIADLSQIPENWFLDRLVHLHSTIRFCGERHHPQYWMCELQHVTGGMLTAGHGSTPQAAIDECIRFVKEKDARYRNMEPGQVKP